MKKLLVLMLVLAIGITTLAGCGNEDPAPSQGEKAFEDLRIAHLTGRLGDQGFVDNVHSGVMRFKEETGCEITVMENMELNDYIINARNFAQEGYDLIILTDAAVSEMVEELAPEYPETHFMIAGGSLTDLDNVSNIIFAQNEMTFLAGAFSVLMNQELGGSAKAGMVVGIRGPALERATYGFTAGSKYVGGDSSLVYVGNFTDVAKGKEIAMQLYQDDIKIVLAFAGGAGIGVFQAAESMPEGYYAMGADDGQFHLSDRIIASTVQSNADAYYHQVRQFAEGKIIPGNVDPVKLDSGAVDFQFAPDYADEIPQEIKDTIEDLKEKIIAGEISAPANEAEYNEFIASLEGK